MYHTIRLLTCSLLLGTTVFAAPGLKSAARLQQIIDSKIDNKLVHGISINVQQGDATWAGSAGALKPESPYFIASTTKLYVTAIIMQLRQEGLLDLDQPAARYLSDSILKDLHWYKGIDYSRKITIRQLLSQTSGLPDYFESRRGSAPSLRSDLSAGKDQHWTFAEAIALSKTMKPKFPPGKKGKALYSDTNFQLLGCIIEAITGISFNEAVQQRICKPLGLKQTYVYTDTADHTPVHLYFKNRALHVPLAMTSFGADGGIVSTAAESMQLLRAFFGGKLFPAACLTEMQLNWNAIFYPLKYGTGLAKFQLPAVFTMFRKYPALIGHSGLSGAFAYYVPDKDIWLTGTVNQVSHPDISYKLMVQILAELMKKT